MFWISSPKAFSLYAKEPKFFPENLVFDKVKSYRLRLNKSRGIKMLEVFVGAGIAFGILGIFFYLILTKRKGVH